MGDVSKLGSALEAFANMRPADDREWDGVACEWVPAGTMAKRKAAVEAALHNERFAASGCSVTDEVHDLLRGGAVRDTPAMQAVADWWEDRTKPWLVLSGPNGCGKSVAAAHLVWTLGGRCIDADELVRVFSSMFGDQYERQQKLRDEHTLVVEEVGNELDDKRMLPALLDLLNARKSARSRPTIVTTNLSKRGFAERYSNDRLTSRMNESVKWVTLTGEDLRRQKS